MYIWDPWDTWDTLRLFSKNKKKKIKKKKIISIRDFYPQSIPRVPKTLITIPIKTI
jgi:hypothetical protein